MDHNNGVIKDCPKLGGTGVLNVKSAVVKGGYYAEVPTKEHLREHKYIETDEERISCKKCLE